MFMYQSVFKSFRVTQIEAEKGQKRLKQQHDDKLSQLAARLSQAQADKEKAEEELQRVKMGPYSQHKDMLQNRELSSHVQQLEEKLGTLERSEKELVRSQFVSSSMAPTPSLPTLLSSSLFSLLLTLLLAKEAGSGRVPAAMPQGKTD